VQQKRAHRLDDGVAGTIAQIAFVAAKKCQELPNELLVDVVEVRIRPEFEKKSEPVRICLVGADAEAAACFALPGESIIEVIGDTLSDAPGRWKAPGSNLPGAA
jgi:hypothetical protein